MLYESGIESFPLDVLEKMWLRELRDVGLSKVEAPPAYPRRQRATRWTEEQLMLVGKFRRLINRSLEAQRDLAAFLEYGTPQQGLPKRVVEQARAQVRAAVLADVEGLSHRDIAVELGTPVPKSHGSDKKVPAVQRMVEAGRDILDNALGEGEWSNRAEWMKWEAEHYLSLDERGRMIEDLVRWHGWSPEVARATREDPTRLESIIRFLHTTASSRLPYPGPYHL
jgi:hypothetical protein